MKTDRDDETTPNGGEANPFLALFPNAQHAKQYMEATRTGLERSVSYSSQESSESVSSSASSTSKINEFTKPKKSLGGVLLDKISSSKQLRKTIEHCHDIIMNDFLQRVFLVTVNAGLCLIDA